MTNSPVVNRARVRADSSEVTQTNDLDPYPVVEVGRFEGGKMWTFDNPPVGYLKDTYALDADSTWFSRARAGALRFADYCSASFVSPRGLVMTNHHCARESVSDVSKPGEDLLDHGFLAQDIESERKVPDLYVEQLVRIVDVTEEVQATARRVQGAGPKAEARQKRVEAIENRYKRDLAREDSSLKAQVVALYSGGRYAVYVYQRYDDVRLVMAPELEVGYFGGDPDNFEYPRHTLDVSFFRVYRNGEPMRTNDFYVWDDDGLSEGDAVFVVGNPGSTSRMSTVSQLEYQRDHELPTSLETLRRRRDMLRSYLRGIASIADSFDVRNDLMALENIIKSQDGQLQGLASGDVLSIRYSAEKVLRSKIMAQDSLQQLYGSVFTDLTLLQRSKTASAARAGAFTHFLNPSASSRILSRAMYGYVYHLLSQRDAPEDQLEQIYDEAHEIDSWPRELEAVFIGERLRDLRSYLGASDPTMKRLLHGLSPQELADSVATYSSVADSAAFADMLEGGFLSHRDIAVDVINAIAPLYFTLDQELQSFRDRETELEARLAMARFAIYGRDVPPDATFTLRIADGRVRGYQLDGHQVEAFTRMSGMYDLVDRYPDPDAWDLPASWMDSRRSVDGNTPLNLVSTNDITGGNSGSPLLDAELEVVGLIFDGNLESLPNDFVYTDEQARAVSVDARAVMEALRDVYRADRLVAEILSGREALGSAGSVN